MNTLNQPFQWTHTTITATATADAPSMWRSAYVALFVLAVLAGYVVMRWV